MFSWKSLALGTVLIFPPYVLSAYGSNCAAVGRESAMAQIGQHRDRGQWLDALAIIECLQQHYPQDEFLYRLQVLTLSDIGSAGRAWQLYQAKPQLFEPEQRDRLQADYFSKQIGWSLAYGRTEEASREEAEEALAQMQFMLDQQGGDAADMPLRLRYDRWIVLNRLARHAQVRDDYRALNQLGNSLPRYVVPAVADSLMATQNPEDAIPLLLAAAEGESGRELDGVHTELGYAYLESGQPHKAIAYLQHWRDSEAPFRRQLGAKQSYQNWARFEADLNLAMVGAYSGDLPSAQRALEQLSEVAPGNGALLSSLGRVYLMRGWPRRALEQQQMASTLNPREVAPRIGQVEAYLELQRDDLARPFYEDLVRHYRDQPEVARLQRGWKAHRGWQLHAYADDGRSSGEADSPLGNDERRYGVEVRSPILDDRWRLLVFANRHRVDYPEQRLQPLRLGAGMEYRYAQIDAQLLLDHANDSIGGVGIRAGVGWQFNDHWHVGFSAVNNDEDASMQARAAGIDADSMALTAEYWRNERRRWLVGGTRFRYADGNQRDVLSSSIEQRLLTRPAVQITGLASGYLGWGSREDAPYFSPRRDRAIEVGVRLDHMPWQRYERHFRHELQLSAGHYWQHGYGDALVPSVSYRHEWQFDVGRLLEYGVRWSRPVYDGQREQHIGLDIAIHWGQ